MVVPEVMHHITQQGNWRLQTFFCDEDYEVYIDLMCPYVEVVTCWCEDVKVENEHKNGTNHYCEVCHVMVYLCQRCGA